MPLVVRGHVPPVDLVEIVEAHADGHLALGRDVGEEAAAEDDGLIGVGEAEDGAVEEDEVAEGGVFVGRGGVLLEGVQDGESFGPAGMVGFVVAEDEHDGLELAQLSRQEGEEIIFVGGDVADVAEQGEVRRLGLDLEDVVGLADFKVQVGDNLDRHFGFRWRGLMSRLLLLGLCLFDVGYLAHTRETAPRTPQLGTQLKHDVMVFGRDSRLSHLAFEPALPFSLGHIVAAACDSGLTGINMLGNGRWLA